MTTLFLVKRLSRLLRIHQITSWFNRKLIIMIILVLLCLLVIALKWLPKLIKSDGQIIALKLFQHFTSIADELENMSPDDYSLVDSAVLVKRLFVKTLLHS